MATERTSSSSSGVHICEIRLKLPGLNDYDRECRSNRYQGAAFKRKTESDISVFLRRLPKLERVRIDFLWVEKNNKRDYDNIAFAKKFILDAMVKMGKLKDDNRKNVVGFSDDFAVGPEYKVILKITEV